MASSRCSICNHPGVVSIDGALAAGGKLIATAETFEVSKSALHRHRQHCGARAVATVFKVDAFSQGSRSIPTSNSADNSVRLPAAIMDAMDPLSTEGGDPWQVLEDKLRQLHAVYAYALSRSVAKDDVASIIRASRAMQRLLEFDLSTAPDRVRCREERLVDPTMRLLARVLGGSNEAMEGPEAPEFATRCNSACATERHAPRGRRRYA